MVTAKGTVEGADWLELMVTVMASETVHVVKELLLWET